MSQAFTEIASSFSQVLHQDLSTLQAQGKMTLLQYVDDFSLCLVIKEVSIIDSIYLLQQLAGKDHKVFKKMLQ